MFKKVMLSVACICTIVSCLCKEMNSLSILLEKNDIRGLNCPMIKMEEWSDKINEEFNFIFKKIVGIDACNLPDCTKNIYTEHLKNIYNNVNNGKSRFFKTTSLLSIDEFVAKEVDIFIQEFDALDRIQPSQLNSVIEEISLKFLKENKCIFNKDSKIDLADLICYYKSTLKKILKKSKSMEKTTISNVSVLVSEKFAKLIKDVNNGTIPQKN